MQTSTAQHTPGPWAVMEINSPEYGHRLDIHSEIGYVAEVQFVVDNNAAARAKYEANARLIAAAPELLEALKTLHRLDESTNGVDMAKYDRAMNAARAAIAKAEGRA